MRSKVLSRVSRQRFSPHGTPLVRIGHPLHEPPTPALRCSLGPGLYVSWSPFPARVTFGAPPDGWRRWPLLEIGADAVDQIDGTGGDNKPLYRPKRIAVTACPERHNNHHLTHLCLSRKKPKNMPEPDPGSAFSVGQQSLRMAQTIRATAWLPYDDPALVVAKF